MYVFYERVDISNQTLSIKAREDDIIISWFIPDHLKIQGMWKSVLQKNSVTLKFIPDHLKAQEMCKKTLLSLDVVLASVDSRYYA